MPRNTRDLRDMVCIITGASSGIGEALARELAGRGARLALAARRHDRLAELNDMFGGRHLVVKTDVADPEQCEALIERTREHFGRIDTLVANAGYGLSKTILETTHEELEQIFRVNVFGTHDCVRPAVRLMREQALREGWRGQIMMTSSGAARRGLPFFGPYSATKAAQLSLAESLRVELADDRIAVTSVHPIGTETGFFEVAEAGGGVKVQGIGSRGKQQTAVHVARRMVRAIARPTREVWPARAYRYLLGLNAVLPSLGDAVMNQQRRQISAAAKDR